MKVIFTCGGTGGHINPAIAVANVLKERDPDCQILFIGGREGMEEDLVPRAGFRMECIRVAGLSRNLNWKGLKWNLKVPGIIRTAIRDCKRIIRQFQPDVIVGTGGFASFPALYAGSRLGIPICVHESNAVPGLTTKLIANRADKVLVCFAESAAHYRNSERVEVVGMPVRREFMSADRESARRELGLDHRPLVVSAFGSLGARAMNEMTVQLLKLEQQAGHPFHHIHATGSFGWEWMPKALEENGVQVNDGQGIDVRQYIYNMPTVMAAADVIISRAGASSCNEICASGTPSILIPSPNVTNHHQEKNAAILANRGAALVVQEPECDAQTLFDVIQRLLSDREKRRSMSAILREMVVLDSAEQICDRIQDLVRK